MLNDSLTLEDLEATARELFASPIEPPRLVIYGGRSLVEALEKEGIIPSSLPESSDTHVFNKKTTRRSRRHGIQF